MPPQISNVSYYLNEPAGQVAKVIITYAVNQVVTSWSHEAVDVNAAIDSIFQCFVHPAFLNPASQIQQNMLGAVKGWLNQVPPERLTRILDGLTRDGVRFGKNRDDSIRAMDKSPVVVEIPAQISTSRAVSVEVARQSPVVGTAVKTVTVSTEATPRDVQTIGSYSQNYYLAQLYGGYAVSSAAQRTYRSDIVDTRGAAAVRDMATTTTTITQVDNKSAITPRATPIAAPVPLPVTSSFISNDVAETRAVNSQVGVTSMAVTDVTSSTITQVDNRATSAASALVSRAAPISPTAYVPGAVTSYTQVVDRMTSPNIRLWPYNMDFYLLADSDPRQQYYSLARYQPYVPVSRQLQDSYATTTAVAYNAGSNLQSTNIQSANVQSANLQSTNLQSTNLQSSAIQNSTLQASNVQSSNILTSSSQSNLQSSQTSLKTSVKTTTVTSTVKSSSASVNSSTAAAVKDAVQNVVTVCPFSSI